MMKHKNNLSKAPEQPKVFDVRRPGRTSVSATSRPVIVGHKPQVQDPMMSHEVEQPSLMDSAQKVTVQPATAPELPTETIAAAEPIEQPMATVTKPGTPTTAPSIPDVPTTSDMPDAANPEPDADAAADLAVVALKDMTDEAERPQSTTAPVLDESALDDIAASTPVSEPPVISPEPTESHPKNDDYFEFPVDEPPQPAEHSDAPLPDLPQEPLQSTKPQIYVSHHPHRSKGTAVWITIVLLVTLVVILDVLLDAGFIVVDAIPHTTFFQ